MNKNLEAFLNKDEKEVIELIDYFNKKFTRIKNERALTKEEDTFILFLNDVIQMLTNQAKQRAEEKEKEEYNKSHPQNIPPCEKCESTENVSFLDITKTKQGYLFNRFRCKKCKVNFLDVMPNNPQDSVKWYKNFIEQLTKPRKGEEGKSYAEVLDVNETEVKDLVRDFEAYIKAIEAEELAIEKVNKANELLNDKIRDIKNTLLVEKLKDFSGGPMGEC